MDRRRGGAEPPAAGKSGNDVPVRIAGRGIAADQKIQPPAVVQRASRRGWSLPDHLGVMRDISQSPVRLTWGKKPGVKLRFSLIQNRSSLHNLIPDVPIARFSRCQGRLSRGECCKRRETGQSRAVTGGRLGEQRIPHHRRSADCCPLAIVQRKNTFRHIA